MSEKQDPQLGCTDVVMPEPCSVCGAPSTHAKRNLYRVTNKDGTYSFAPAGVFYWRCDTHTQEPLMYDIGHLRDVEA
jgi:hypothetical protein